MDTVWIFGKSKNLNDDLSQTWELIGDRLIKEGLWGKVYRSTHKPSFDDLVTLKNKYCIPDHLRKKRIPIYDNLMKERYVILDMLYRKTDWGTDRYNSASFHELSNRIWLYFEYAFNFIIKNRITLLLYWNLPHMGWNYIPFKVAEALDVKTLFLDQSKFTNKFFHYFDFYDHGTFKTSKILNHKTEYTIEKRVEKEWFYMKKNYGIKKKYSIKKLLNPEKYGKRIAYAIEKNDYLRLFRELCSQERRAQAFFRFYTERTYKREFKKACVEDVSLHRKYVYFPLHKQPERNPTIHGGPYLDQMLAVERLAELLPDDWFIYVKESPLQSTGAYRDVLFFKRLKLIPNAVLIGKNVNTFDLIRHSQFVATIVGTVGWEAITGGKNALIFGWGTWYKTLPGVYEYHPDLDVHELADAKFDHHELEKKTAEIYNKCGTGLVNMQWAPDIQNFDFAENIDTVVASLKQILYEPR
jgi:hypothetical protein